MPRKNSVVRMFNEQCKLCCYCGQKMTLKLGKKRTATREHILAKSNGGNCKDNFAAACYDCNRAKGSMPLVIFLLKGGANRPSQPSPRT